jgi:hypothetical protein
MVNKPHASNRANTMTYWLDLFTGVTWNEFRKSGGKVSGFRETRWTTVQKINERDIFLCYLTGISRFVGLLEVTGKPFISVHDLRGRLSCFLKSEATNAWTGAFRGSPTKWSQSDGEAVVEALRNAEQHPKKLPTDPKKLARKPPAFINKDKKAVTIPENDDLPRSDIPDTAETSPTEHTEMQALLVRLGAAMGFDVWVARDDRNRIYDGKPLGQLPSIKDGLPLQFDDATNRTIELIDVLWLRGNSIVAAFEVESTTSIYSGLLRMSDLTAMQPNLNIPLYLVAPDDRRDKVFTEINRPTFSRLNRRFRNCAGSSHSQI